MRYVCFVKIAAVLCIVPALSCACRRGSKALSTSGNALTATVSGENSAAFRQNGPPLQYTYTVKAVYPHDPTSYTQGLYWHDGYLWEGTGQYRQSTLKKVDLASGKATETIPLPENYFGEGIALLDGKIYQLTWTNSVALVYDAATLKKTGEFRYAGEGWGITTDGEQLYMSDGSHEISVIDPDGFKTDRKVEVKISKRRVHKINEMEWIEGRIWANVYMTDAIVIINPETGMVEGVVDLEGLLPAADRTPATDVLNGIAYDPVGKRIFVTGKNWSKLFEIEISEK